MSTWIVTDICINCGACEPVCPNQAITDGSDVGADTYFIHHDKCTECVGEADHEQCQEVCPVLCCLPDPNHLEDESTLAQRALQLHPDDEELKTRIESGNFPSLKRRLPIV